MKTNKPLPWLMISSLAAAMLTICSNAQTTAPAQVQPAAPSAATPAVAAPVATAPAVLQQRALPPVSNADLKYATRVALAQGVLFLKQLAEKDPQGWIVPPVQKLRLVGYKDVPRKYKMVEVTRPIYEYEYGPDIIIFIPGTSPSQPDRKVVRKVITKAKQVGTTKVTIEQFDPNGPLEKIWKQPIYEFIGDVRWHFSNIGDSAMALGALRAAGVPESDPAVQRMVENLTDFLNAFGPPDETWNLAWLTIAMAQTGGDVAAEWTQKLASRLFDGQITEGAARGFWGPMCVHPRLLSILARNYIAAEAELSKRKLKYNENPTKQNQARVDEAEANSNRFQKIANGWSRAALRFANAEQPMEVEGGGTKEFFPGSTEYYYTQRSADLESTWIALHALSVAAEARRLPKESFRPSTKALTDTGAPKGSTSMSIFKVDSTTVPPESAMAVLARAANAIKTAQPADGRWTECNFHQPVTDFDSFIGVLPVPSDPKSFPLLASPVSALSAAQGIAALDSISRAVGMDKMANFLPNYTAGANGRTAEGLALIKTVWPKPTVRPVLTPALYNLFLTAARPLSIGVPSDTSAGQMEDQLTQLLILAGNPAGGWGIGAKRSFIPSSSRERYAALKANLSLNTLANMNKAHIRDGNGFPSGLNTSDAAPFATAAAVYFLAGRLENPGATVQELSVDPALADLRKEVNVLLMTIPAVAKPVPAVVVPASSAVPGKKPASPEDLVPDIPVKPLDTKKKTDESF